MSPRGLRMAATSLLAAGLTAAGGSGDDGASGRRAGVSPPRARVERQAYLMGTRVTLVTLATDRAEGLLLLERMLRGLEVVEGELTTWREDSQLSSINRLPVGTSRPAPEALCDLLEELKDWHRITAGAFDPAVGSLIAVWGLREGGRIPSPAEIAKARADAGLEHILVQPDPCHVTRRREVILDAGGFGKGRAIDHVAETVLADFSGAWMLDLGGQLAVGSGDGEQWPVALAHPQRRDEAVLEVELSSGSLATSGGSVRDVAVAGQTVGHILDPRRGLPVSRAESVTVWHRSALAADVLSTALYVMGVDEGLAWAEAGQIAACFLVPEPEGSRVTIRATSAFRRRFLSRRTTVATTAPGRAESRGAPPPLVHMFSLIRPAAPASKPAP